ncbi:hypothetical protein I204_04366 [Kwoniella mangroviensis CBS 8886]|nr:hypothetical protein I204_04366 [Kwoniella mangroviensis CBS 8886]
MSEDTAIDWRWEDVTHERFSGEYEDMNTDIPYSDALKESSRNQTARIDILLWEIPEPTETLDQFAKKVFENSNKTVEFVPPPSRTTRTSQSEEKCRFKTRRSDRTGYLYHMTSCGTLEIHRDDCIDLKNSYRPTFNSIHLRAMLKSLSDEWVIENYLAKERHLPIRSASTRISSVFERSLLWSVHWHAHQLNKVIPNGDLDTAEFKKRIDQSLLIGTAGKFMDKSKGTVIDEKVLTIASC